MLEKLKEAGFYFYSLNDLVQKNAGNYSFVTHNYFVIIWSATKELSGTIENDEYKVPANSLLYVSPNKKLTLANKDFDGYAFIFTSEFFERSDFDSSLLNSNLFYDKEDEFFISPSPFQISFFKKFYITRLLNSKDIERHLYLSMARNTVESLILEGVRHLNRHEQTRHKEIHHPENAAYNKFMVHLQQNYKKERTVNFYADILNMTPRSLNKITIAVAEKNAKDIIIEKIVKESKRMLKYTNETVYNISWQLGFSDEGNFSSFFKKHTGQSPHEFKVTNPILKVV